jgi:multidrug efflux pump subunit AcrB
MLYGTKDGGLWLSSTSRIIPFLGTTISRVIVFFPPIFSKYMRLSICDELAGTLSFCSSDSELSSIMFTELASRLHMKDVFEVSESMSACNLIHSFSTFFL